ncbi:hypothetical protein PLANPX_5196 [Lacipirellula parvula]|uniref:Peptidase C1A papain C-terminal domain-containing protein n=2 Tax=Lacipirellula parvula TaxID=2650471 RepID=A0A5K7XFD5_9BACT|nr:hypothetical protein PLANPX_5196 [Lacipirellula parvula]
MGWIPDLPDPRDFTYRSTAVLPLLVRLNRTQSETLPDEVDLRRDEEVDYFTDVEDQGTLNSSAAFAVLSLIEYFERRVRGHTFEGSKLFLYKVTRNLRQKRPANCLGSHSREDTGADLRTTLKVMTRVGAPPEEIAPYEMERFDQEPSAFQYALARPLTDVRYFRLDEPTQDASILWEVITSFLSAGFPIAIGFPVPTSLTIDPDIPYRSSLERIRGGQAVVAVGYRKDHLGRGQHAILIRSSWGSHWGDGGNGWLPFTYLRNRMARDLWTLISPRWLEPGELLQPTVSTVR